MINKNFILMAISMVVLLLACKNEKATKSLGETETMIENVVESTVGTASDLMESNEGEVAIGNEVESQAENVGNQTIGSDEVAEMKKAAVEEARKPKLGKIKPTATKPTAGKPTAGKPTSSLESPSSDSDVIDFEKPQASTPSTTKPTGTKPTGTKPTGTKPTGTRPAGTKVTTPKPTQTKPTSNTNTSTNTTTETNTNSTAANTSKSSGVLKEVKDKVGSSSNTEPEKVGKITKPSQGQSAGTKIGTAVKALNHESFNTLLNKYVSNGVVDYSGLKSTARALNSYCKNLSENSPQDSWTKNEKLAYWMNAYNAFTLKLITDNFPLGSVTELHGGKPWDKKWIVIGDETLSLNGIENDIIRPRYNDARIHFGLNCAAKSCPPLANYAFTAANVDSKLNALTKSFINSSANTIGTDEINVSKIFDWYKSDFGDVVAFVNKYASTKASANAKVKFMEYDWSLNGK